MSELQKISDNVIKVCATVEHIKTTITEMKAEREKHKGEFWTNMKAMQESLRTEQEERKLSDEKIKSDIKLMKGKLAVYVTVMSTAFAVFISWLRTK